MYKTIATASFKTDSPNTFEYKLGSTPSSLKMDKTVTGSVADKMAPKNMQSMRLRVVEVKPIAEAA